MNEENMHSRYTEMKEEEEGKKQTTNISRSK